MSGLYDYEQIYECNACGKTNVELAQELDVTLKEIEDDGIFTLGGEWYCHADCFRESND